MLPSNIAQSTPKHLATSSVLIFTDLWPEEGKWKVSHSAPGVRKLQWGQTSSMKFLFFEDSIILLGALGRMTATLILSCWRKENSLSWSLNSFPELEEIISTHTELKQDTYVCHQKSFIKVHVCLWQQNTLNIFQSQQDSGNNIHKVVIDTGMILEELDEGRQDGEWTSWTFKAIAWI